MARQIEKKMRIKKKNWAEKFPSNEDISHAKWLGNNNTGLLYNRKHCNNCKRQSNFKIV